MFKNWFKKEKDEKKEEQRPEEQIQQDVQEYDHDAVIEHEEQQAQDIMEPEKPVDSHMEEPKKEENGLFSFFQEKKEEPQQPENKATETPIEPVEEPQKEEKGLFSFFQEKKEEPVEEKKPEQDVLRFDKPKKNIFDKLKDSLEKTRSKLTDQIDEVIKGYAKIDEELFEDLEDILVSSDMGMKTTMTVMDALRDKVRKNGVTDPLEVKNLLKEELISMIESTEQNSEMTKERPLISLIIGVNGVGKTTSIGKLAAQYKENGETVLLAAADTFRAAAIDQLKIWAERANTDIVYQQEGADPASVVYDAIARARTDKTDVLLCDTAGRLHNKSNLMKELEKIYRVIEREYPTAARETLLVLDATTGQNALSQAQQFSEVAQPTGIILTKLDGTAKGGVVFPLMLEYKIPVKYIGIGEGVHDLEPFDPKAFVEAIFA